MRVQKNRRNKERGVALVIAIFTLMLISVVATAMILMAGTETAVKGNYKSAMHAFYDARAGLEEGRGRLGLSTRNPNNPNSIMPCLGGAAPMPVGQVCYILNPSSGETVDPTDPNSPYADTEYQAEWNTAIPTGANYNTVMSNSPVANIAGPLYKWVRITPRTEFSGNIDVDGINGKDNLNPLFYDGTQTSVGPVQGASQVLTITALAVTPLKSRRMVQYTVALGGSAAGLANFPSALTLDGNGVSFAGSSGGGEGGSGNFQIVGKDLPQESGVPAIGYTNSSDGTSVSTAATPSSNYVSPQNVPSVSYLPPWTPQTESGLPLILQTPNGLDTLVKSVTQNADLVINSPQTSAADQQSLPSAMSASNPMVVVVNGDFSLTHASGMSAFTGYGLLLVTGTLHYDPDDSWNGVILVIGKGVFDGSRNGKGGQINGAVLVARTLDNAGSLLTSLGSASFNGSGGGKIQYSSGGVKAALALMPYQVLSFREIPQTTP